MSLVLFPCDPVQPRAPDPAFAREVAAAEALGLRVGVIDHDEAGLPRAPTPARCCARSRPGLERGSVIRRAAREGP